MPCAEKASRRGPCTGSPGRPDSTGSTSAVIARLLNSVPPAELELWPAGHLGQRVRGGPAVAPPGAVRHGERVAPAGVVRGDAGRGWHVPGMAGSPGQQPGRLGRDRLLELQPDLVHVPAAGL